jgi:hypothetical protein
LIPESVSAQSLRVQGYPEWKLVTPFHISPGGIPWAYSAASPTWAEEPPPESEAVFLYSSFKQDWKAHTDTELKARSPFRLEKDTEFSVNAVFQSLVALIVIIIADF